MHRLLHSKGQFFFISLMLVLLFVSGVNAIFAEFSDVDLSNSFTDQNQFIFWNIKHQIIRMFNQRKCPELENDFKEVKFITEHYLASRGIEFELKNASSICPPGDVVIEMNLTSGNINIFDNFTLTSS